MNKYFILTIIIGIFLLLSACGNNNISTSQPMIKTQSVYPIEENVNYPSPNSTQIQLLIPTPTPDPVNNPVVISHFTFENGIETIYVTNISNKDQDINGFSLYNPDTTENINIFNVELKPGESVKIYNGVNAKGNTDGLYWKDTPILQKEGDGIYLLNRAGRLIWAFMYYP